MKSNNRKNRKSIKKPTLRKTTSLKNETTSQKVETRGSNKYSATIKNVEDKRCFSLSSPEDVARLRARLKNVTYVQQTNTPLSEFTAIEDALMIAPVAVLQKKNMPNIMGVFTKTKMTHRTDLCLGQYIGDILNTNQIKRDKNFDGDYAIELNNGTTVDAKKLRGWPAMVNATSSYESSNVLAKRIKNEVYYYLIRSIKPGEQLLIYYGDDYSFKDKRFLNPSDNWKESQEKFLEFEPYYTVNNSLDRQLIELFDMSSELYFAIPDPEQVGSMPNVDIPVLAYGDKLNFLAQHQQENITLLMLACWKGDLQLVQHLLTRGANPYQQASIHGYSPLHCIILSPHLTQATKKQLLQLITEEAGMALKLQDYNDESILHLAIKTKQIELIDPILRRAKSHSRHGENKSILDCVNQDEEDAFICAIKSADAELIRAALPYLRSQEVDEYQSSPKLLKKALKDASRLLNPSEFECYIETIRDALKLKAPYKDQFIKLIDKNRPQKEASTGLKRNSHFARKEQTSAKTTTEQQHSMSTRKSPRS